MLANYSTSLFRFVSVEKAADYFAVSTRRIRTLLAEGRLSGEKFGKSWQVRFPYIISMGRRGPPMLQRINASNNIAKLRNTSMRNSIEKKQEV
jgi:excisionase family DNA binding protein